MKTLILLTVLSFLLVVNGSKHLRRIYKDTGRLFGPQQAVEEPLILTPFINEGRIEEAQQAARVQSSLFHDVVSYAGYFTVDERFDSNLWFWYFPSADNVSDDPVVLWLNGGPGASSLNGLFDENGPFIVNEDYSVSLREYSWHLNQSIIFFDNPVGVGFSFTNGGLAENETKVGEDMHSALVQFFQLFPELQSNPFFISGESYAGKYLPAIAYTILQKNPSADLPLNLQGVLIGDGWTDPIHQMDYGPFVYNTGLVSEDVKKVIDRHRDAAIAAIEAEQWLEAGDHSDDIYDLILDNADVNIYNYIEEYDDPDKWAEFLSRDELREVIHVGGTLFGDKGAGSALEIDVTKSVAPWVEELLEHYPILIYTGQVDIICGYPMVLDYVKTLEFSGADEYKGDTRRIWYVDDEPAGYVRTGGNLVELLVRNSGHMVPRDQPKWAYDMLYRFTRNLPFA
uniref:Carboxypeptidase n=1 Tax=Dendroctonus ponderosae TaxID=77166 RepID=J3JX36_DENPD|nr:unknown [Dendroctonus ponderosae]